MIGKLYLGNPLESISIDEETGLKWRLCRWCGLRKANGKWKYKAGMLSTAKPKPFHPNSVWKVCELCGGKAYLPFYDPPKTLWDWLYLTGNDSWIWNVAKVERHLKWKVLRYDKKAESCVITSSRSKWIKEVREYRYGWSYCRRALGIFKLEEKT